MHSGTRAALTALTAAALFGAATPLAKLLLGTLDPFTVAGLFYLGSGAGLAACLAVRRLVRPASAHERDSRLRLAEWPWLAGAVLAGGVAGPALLMLGLTSTPAATSSLLLNVEGVLTAMIAWVVFRENVDWRVFLGMMAIVAGGLMLSSRSGAGAGAMPAGALMIVGACLCWAIDNNLTRKVSGNDAAVIACIKGLVAGPVNLAIAAALGARMPSAHLVFAAMTTGFMGYGVSLVLFVLALRSLGTARTGAYFSVAPLFGVALSLLLWPAMPGWTFWAAGALMAVGVALHLRERHEHPHTHDELEHNHLHRHDEHHRHPHDFPYDGDAPHSHAHRHLPVTHTHAHYPDIHHRHSH
jgi:drug/metabolite transporter (DMT)-like permease